MLQLERLPHPPSLHKPFLFVPVVRVVIFDFHTALPVCFIALVVAELCKVLGSKNDVHKRLEHAPQLSATRVHCSNSGRSLCHDSGHVSVASERARQNCGRERWVRRQQ
jgi:hypothetical protein